MNYLNFPEELRALKQWVCWKYIDKGGKPTKIPFQPSGSPASSKDPQTWSTFFDCLAVKSKFDGLGFVFDQGVVGIDLDKCFNPDGTLHPWAREIVDRFSSYTEKSPSGTGLHVLILSDVKLSEIPGADPSGDGGRQTNVGDHSKIECYGHGRYFTVTGDVFENLNKIHDRDIIEWYQDTFPSATTAQAESKPVASYLPEDDRILNVMFSSKGGDRLSKLFYQGSDPGADQSRDDMTLAGALMFFCGNNQDVARRLLLQSKLKRDKWDRPDYLDRTLSRAAHNDTMAWDPNFDSGGEAGHEQGAKFILTEDGKKIVNIENICLTLTLDPKYAGKITTNGDSGRLELSGKEMSDGDVLEIVSDLQRRYSYLARVGRQLVFDAVSLVAFRNVTHPRAEFVKSLVWDKVPRLDSWLSRVCYTPDDDLHRAISSNFVKGMVRRITDPGCKFDEVLVLSGPQGCGKSTVMETWGGGTGTGPGSGWHAGTTLDAGNKDMYMLFKSKVIIEFTEGAVLSKKSASELKAIISDRQDTYRVPYGKLDTTVNRSCIFAMTTNHENYLQDETGNRRFLPVKVGATKDRMCDSAWLAENREQLLAEAYYRITTLNEPSHVYPWHILKDSQDGAQRVDEYDLPVERWYESLPASAREEGITGLQVWCECIHRTEGTILNPATTSTVPTFTRRDQDWIADILRRHLKLEKKCVWRDGKAQKRWLKP